MNTLLIFLLLFSSLYPNLYNSEIISNVREDLTNKSGIYLLICNTTGKIYLGSAINLRKRFNEHLKGSNSNLLLLKSTELKTLLLLFLRFVTLRSLLHLNNIIWMS